MFLTDFIFRQQENLSKIQPEMSGWIQATMQQNTILVQIKQIFGPSYFVRASTVCKMWPHHQDFLSNSI